MRLRYVHVADYPPLLDTAISFGHEEILARPCSIHFVVGLNGTGKSRLLHAIAETLLCLERKEVPPFGITLAYDLGSQEVARTIYFHNHGRSTATAVLVEFPATLDDPVDWESLSAVDWKNPDGWPLRAQRVFFGDQLPGSSALYLPTTILAFTSGATTPWERIFAPALASDEADHSAENDGELMSAAEERPVDWTTTLQSALAGEDLLASMRAAIDQLQPDPRLGVPHATASVGLLVHPDALKLAFFATALFALRDDLASPLPAQNAAPSEDASPQPLARITTTGIRSITEQVGMGAPVNLSLYIRFQHELFSDFEAKLKALYEIAVSVRKEPGPRLRRHLFFDLTSTMAGLDTPDQPSVQALIQALAGDNATPLDVFRQLLIWWNQGFLIDATIAITKKSQQNPDLLLYDWLSDGERAFLGRMALFHLLGGNGSAAANDALILLDEPETHFNDYWKREIVDIIDDSLGNSTAEVVISTHSSIALTDALDSEITLLEKRGIGERVAALIPPVPTFAASPSDIMRHLFGAPNSIGQRAKEFLDLVLALVSHPQDVEAVWSQESPPDYLPARLSVVRGSREFERLRAHTKDLPYFVLKGDDEGVRLLELLRSLRAYATTVSDSRPPTAIDLLRALEDRLGTGYYQFEFGRRADALAHQQRDVS